MPEDTLESILSNARLSADERKVFEKALNENPELKKGWLRQSDYSRNMDQVTARKKEYDEAVAFNERMKTWADEKIPIWEGLVAAGAIDEESKPLWPAEKERLAKELEDAKKAAVAGADMDPAELDRRVRDIVKAAGGATSEEIKALVASEAAKMAAETFDNKYKEVEKNFNEKTIPFSMGISAANSLAALDYEKVTGEEFTDDKQKELFTLMTKENNFNPRAVMKIMLKPVIEKKATEVEVERLANERAAKILRDRGELVDGEPFIPVPDKQNQPRGSLQRLLDDSKDEGDVESLAMAAGRKAAAELRSEGKY